MTVDIQAKLAGIDEKIGQLQQTMARMVECFERIVTLETRYQGFNDEINRIREKAEDAERRMNAIEIEAATAKAKTGLLTGGISAVLAVILSEAVHFMIGRGSPH